MSAVEIPSYDVWGLLGVGGMSEVWLAKHVALAAPVVVKTLRLGANGTRSAGARVLSEARLMARLSCPQIVRALDAGEIEDKHTPFLVQEYVDGLDLNELDRRRRRALGVGLPLWFVCHVMREVATGVRAAHHAGVIHRDLKPSNIFGTATSTPSTSTQIGIRLGDFGIAVARRTSLDALSHPKDEAAGTLAFMAPEQYGGGELVRATDVWGAAATACDLRYGRPPFESVSEIVDASFAPRMPPPRTPQEAYFQQVLRGMLEKDVARRPADMSGPLAHFAMLARVLEPPPPIGTRAEDGALRVGPLDLRFVVGDIAEARADAIVSSANYRLTMRSGVGDALRRRGGDRIEEEARAGGELALGSCLRTGAGTLDARHILHAVGAWNEVSCLGRAFARALLTSDELGCATLAAPALGTGAGRVGLEMCAHAMMTTLRLHLLLGGTRLRGLTLYLDSEAKRRAFEEIAVEVFGSGDALGLGGQDLGLPVFASEPVSGDAETCIDVPGA